MAKRPLPEGEPAPLFRNVAEGTDSTGLETPGWEKTVRISNVPVTVTEQDLLQILEGLPVSRSGEISHKRTREGNILGFSLSPSPPASDCNRYQVATVTFKKTPHQIGPLLGPAGARFEVDVDTHFKGLTPLNNPSDPLVDIISITGLGGHAFGSWRSRSRVSHVMWLRDILPEDLRSNGQSARVFTYGYDTTLQESTSDAGIKDLSRRFLSAVNRTRPKQDPHRPIIFIAHSLGGLIIKRALIEAHGNFADLFRSCYGMLFFGVPNKGLEIRGLMEMTNEQPNRDFICDLGAKSQFLGLLDDIFIQLLKPLNIKVVSFYEERDTKMVKEIASNKWARAGEYIRMVTRESAISPLSMANEASDVFPLDADHSTMVKFDCRLDSNYQDVRTKILELAEAATRVIEERFAVYRRGTVHDLSNNNIGLSLENTEDRDKERKSVLSWLSKLEPENDHERINAKKYKDTGKWFLESMEVQGWILIKESCLLWCHGKAGVGKSVLTSILLEDIRSKYSSVGHIGIAFFYFNFQNEDTQKATDVLSILLKQLCRQLKKEIPQSLTNLYKECTPNDRSPRLKELQDQFQTIAGLFEEVFLVIDAMDECKDDRRTQLLPYITALLKCCSTKLKIFITSRPEPDIKLTFASNECKAIQIEAKKVDEDIQTYVHSVLENRVHHYCNLDYPLRQRIEKALVSRSNGMFLWVRCQMDEIYRQPSISDIIDCLQFLPKDMTETYTRILDRIYSQSQPQSMQTIAKRALTWVITAKRPLTPEELAIVVAIEQIPESMEGLHKKYKPQAVIDSCCGLLTIERESVRPIHFSVKEFLQRRFNEGEANAELARSSIHYLLSVEVSEIMYGLGREKGCGNMYYIYNFWHQHIQGLQIPLPEDFKSLVEGFLKCQNLTLLFHMITYSYYKFVTVLDLCVVADILPVYRQCYQGRSAISSRYAKEAVQEAARNGKLSAITTLLEIMSEKDARDSYPLCLAAQAGHSDVVQLFINYGVDVNARCHRFLTALHAAAIHGQNNVVEMLIKNGADLNIHDEKHPTALQAATYRGYKKTVEILLRKGANVNLVGGNDSALQMAAIQGYQEIVEILIANGAEVNFQGGIYGTALLAAVAGYKVNSPCVSVGLYAENIVEFLLRKGADPNIQAVTYGTALQIAAYRGYGMVVNTLLENGADVNIQGGRYGTALQAAAYNGSDTIVKTLLENGADVNIQCGEYGTALQAAAYRGYGTVVDTLLENGADVNIQGGRNGTALQAAALYGYSTIVNTILENGADVNIQCGEYGTALQAAAYRGYGTVVDTLLENGADVNIQGGRHGTALQAAALYGYSTIVNTILENGADVNTQGGRYGTALHAAVICQYHQKTQADIIRILLQKGADVNAQCEIYGSALAASRKFSRTTITNLLLENGAKETI